MATKSIGLRQYPVWVRGPAHIDGDEIVLNVEEARPFDAFEPEHYQTLLPDLAALHDPKLQDPVAFVRRHGLLWHGPNEVDKGECRESLRDWSIEGLELHITILLYVALNEGIDAHSGEPVRRFLRSLRDIGVVWGRLPDDEGECLESASIHLAERITRVLEGCNQTFVAACSLVRDGKKVGPAGDFRFSIDPPNLVGAAYNELASLIVTRAEFRECVGCGRLFQPDHGRQIHHTKSCGNRKRQHKHRYG
jgi:hypothetical protein